MIYLQRHTMDLTKKIVLVLSAVTAIATVSQIALGADFVILMMALCAIASGLAGFYLLGSYNLVGWWFLLYVIGHVGVALVAKTLYRQPLESYLYAPFHSYLIEAVTCFIALCTIILVIWTNTGKPLFEKITDPGLLLFLSWSCFFIGSAVMLLFRLIAGGDKSGGASYGGIAFLESLAYMGIIARTAYLAQASHGKKFLDSKLLFMLVSLTGLGILAGGKSSTAVPWLCFLLTVIFFAGKLPWRYVGFMLAGGLLFVLFLSPFIHILRGLQLRDASLGEEISLMEHYLPLILNPDEFLFFAQRASTDTNYFHYFGSPKEGILLPRFTSVQQIDPVIVPRDAGDRMDTKLALDAVKANLPKFLVPDKPTETNAYTILVHEGYVPVYSTGHYPTLPYSGEIYLIFGWPGVIAGSFALLFLYFLALKKIGWNLYCNIFSVFLFGSSLYHSNEMSLQDFIGQIIRDFPIFVLLIIFLVRAYYVFSRRILTKQESYAGT